MFITAEFPARPSARVRLGDGARVGRVGGRESGVNSGRRGGERCGRAPGGEGATRGRRPHRRDLRSSSDLRRLHRGQREPAGRAADASVPGELPALPEPSGRQALHEDLCLLSPQSARRAGKGWVDEGRTRELCALKTGRRRLRGVCIDIIDARTSNARQCVMVHNPAYLNRMLPDRVSIPIGRKAASRSAPSSTPVPRAAPAPAAHRPPPSLRGA